MTLGYPFKDKSKKIMTWDMNRITDFMIQDSGEMIIPLSGNLNDLKKLKNLKELTIHSLDTDSENLSVLSELTI